MDPKELLLRHFEKVIAAGVTASWFKFWFFAKHFPGLVAWYKRTGKPPTPEEYILTVRPA